MTTLQILLLCTGGLVVLLAVVMQRYRLVTTSQPGGKRTFTWCVVAALVCFFVPALIRWLRQA